MTRYFLTPFLLIAFSNLFGQLEPLNNYINEGLENNLVIQQNRFSLTSAQQALKIAKGYYLPQAILQSRFSLATGGRTIDFPIGDMLNPVYNTLNQILESQSETGTFPSLKNEQINLMREKEYDMHVSLIQPIYNKSISVNRKIAHMQLSMSQTELEQFKRELTYQIKEAYFNYLKTIQLKQLVERTKTVVEENYRISKKLFENQLNTKDAILRAKADINRVLLLDTEITTQSKLTKSYFNFLLNRDLNHDIILIDAIEYPIVLKTDSLTLCAVSKREEINLLKDKAQIYDYIAALSSSEILPNLMLAIDYGIEGDEFSGFSNNDYAIGSVVLKWNLFNGNINRNKRQQAIINQQKTELEISDAIHQIQLEIEQDYLQVEQLKQNLVTSHARNSESDEVYRMVEKRYREGKSALIELLDARNNMVEAESELINTQYDLLICIARLEKSSHSQLLPW